MIRSQHLISDGPLNIHQGSIGFRHLGIPIAGGDDNDDVQFPREFVQLLGPRELTTVFVRRQVVTNRKVEHPAAPLIVKVANGIFNRVFDSVLIREDGSRPAWIYRVLFVSKHLRRANSNLWVPLPSLDTVRDVAVHGKPCDRGTVAVLVYLGILAGIEVALRNYPIPQKWMTGNDATIHDA